MSNLGIIISFILQLVTIMLLHSCSDYDRQRMNTYHQRVFDRGSRECGYAVIGAVAEEIVITGSGPGINKIDENVYAARLSDAGEILGEVTYGGNRPDVGRAITATPDGGYAIVGATQSYGAGMADVFLIRLSATGDSLWAKTFGGPSTDEGWSIAVAPDSGFIIAGLTRSYGHGGQDAYLIRTNSAGDTMWTRCFGGAADDDAKSVIATPDGGYFVTGSTHSFGAGNSDVYMIKCNTDGDSVWAATYGTVDYEEGNCAVQTQDRAYIVTGSTHMNAPAGDVLLLKVDSRGERVWSRTYGSYQGDCGLDLTIAPDGGFVVTGYFTTPAHPDTPISSDIYLIKTDDRGHLIWERNFGGTQQDCGYGVVARIDGSYIVVGGTSSFDGTEADIVWLKAFEPELQ